VCLKTANAIGLYPILQTVLKPRRHENTKILEFLVVGSYEKGKMTMLDTIFARRSIRRYTDEPVTETQIKTILEAAMAAPSANNSQPWHFVVVRDRELLRQLADVHPYGKMLAQAAAGIAVCADPNLDPRYWVQDCSAATENLLLAITALGLGGVWLGVHPRPEREEPIRRILRIPDKMQILCLVALGHPAERKPPRTQYDETRVHYDRW